MSRPLIPVGDVVELPGGKSIRCVKVEAHGAVFDRDPGHVHHTFAVIQEAIMGGAIVWRQEGGS